MLYFVPVLRGYDWYVCCYVRKNDIPSVFAITERRDMVLYDVPMSMSLLCFWMGTVLANCHICGIWLPPASEHRT